MKPERTRGRMASQDTKQKAVGIKRQITTPAQNIPKKGGVDVVEIFSSQHARRPCDNPSTRLHQVHSVLPYCLLSCRFFSFYRVLYRTAQYRYIQRNRHRRLFVQTYSVYSIWLVLSSTK